MELSSLVCRSTQIFGRTAGVSNLGCNLDDDLGDRSCLNFTFVHHIFAGHHFKQDLFSSDFPDNQNFNRGSGTAFSSHFALNIVGESPCCFLRLSHHDGLNCRVSNRRVFLHLLVVLGRITSCCSLDLDRGIDRRKNAVHISTVSRTLASDRKKIAERRSCFVGLSCLGSNLG